LSSGGKELKKFIAAVGKFLLGFVGFFFLFYLVATLWMTLVSSVSRRATPEEMAFLEKRTNEVRAMGVPAVKVDPMPGPGILAGIGGFDPVELVKGSKVEADCSLGIIYLGSKPSEPVCSASRIAFDQLKVKPVDEIQSVVRQAKEILAAEKNERVPEGQTAPQ